MNRYLWSLALLISLLIPGLTSGENQPTSASATPTVNKKSHKHKSTHLKKQTWKPNAKIMSATPTQESSSDFKVTGYIDGSYNNLQKNYFTSGSFDRVFDNEQNGFTLHQAAATLAYQPANGFGIVLNPILGYDTNIFAPYGFIPNSEFDSQTISIDVPQAYLQFAHHSFTLALGRFDTIVGAEVIDPTQNYNFSRSILDGFAEPFTVTGLRATYVVNNKMTLVGGINNGWDNIRDWSRDKTFELNGTYTPNSAFSFESTIYTGQERATPLTNSGPLGWRTLVDMVATFNVTDKLSIIGNYDYGWQTKAALPNGTNNKAIWQGLAAYLNYKLNDYWLSSLRGEFFNDQNGFRTGVVQYWKELTFSVGYLPIKNLEFRAEARHDFSNVGSFTTINGTSISHNAQSYALEGFYKFG